MKKILLLLGFCAIACSSSTEPTSNNFTAGAYMIDSASFSIVEVGASGQPWDSGSLPGSLPDPIVALSKNDALLSSKSGSDLLKGSAPFGTLTTINSSDIFNVTLSDDDGALNPNDPIGTVSVSGAQIFNYGKGNYISMAVVTGAGNINYVRLYITKQ